MRIDRLPVEPVDRLTKPFAWFLRIEHLATRRDLSDQTAREVDCAVRDLVSQAFERAVAILEAHRDALAESTERLLEEETLRGDELPMLIAEPAPRIPVGKVGK